MRSLLTTYLLLLTLLAIVIPPAVPSTASTLFDVPRIEGISLDGSEEDWAEQGFRVEFLTSPDGRALPANDFDVKFLLGWNQEGLLVLAAVNDDVPVEHGELSGMWRRDCVELFVADTVGSSNRYQLVLGPGADPAYGAVRTKLYDWRSNKEGLPELAVQAASRSVDRGYVLEVLLPWKNLAMEATPGMEIAFQFIANDDDDSPDDSRGTFRAAWYPRIGSHEDATLMHRIRLAEEPSDAVLLRVERQVGLGQCTVSIRGSNAMIGEAVIVSSEDKVIAEGTIAPKHGRAGLELAIPLPADVDAWPRIDVAVAGKSMAMFEARSTLDSVIERYIEAVGGLAAIQNLTTRVCSGKLVTDLPSRTPPFYEALTIEASAKVPHKWLLVSRDSEAVHKYGSDGEIGWRQGLDSIDRDETMRRPKLAFLLDPQGPLHLQDYFPAMDLKGTDATGGREVYVVESERDRAHYTLYFDVETGILSQIGYWWDLEDYREVDGVKFPFRIVTGRKGGSSTYSFNEVRHNVTLEDAVFAKPDPATVFADAFEGIGDPKVLPMLKELPYVHGGMNIPCQDGRLLYNLITQNGYKRGLEIGTSNACPRGAGEFQKSRVGWSNRF